MAFKNKISGIYVITCILDNKVYIGYSSCIQQRLLDHQKMLKWDKHDNIHLQRAYNKYGKNNFTFEVLEEYPDEGFILPSMEHYWCNLLLAHNPEFGYNIKPTHPYNKVSHSEETKKKLSIAHKGKIVSQETRAKQSKAKTGVKWSEESKKKLSETRKGKTKNFSKEAKLNIAELNKVRNSKPVILLSLFGDFLLEFNSIKECAEYIGVVESNVSSMVTRKNQNRVKNYIVVLKKDYDPNKQYNYKNANCKSVIQLDLNGNFIKEWESVIEAAKGVNGAQSHISSCCRGERKTHKGFIWKYKQ